MSRGLFLVLEGIDASGTTTQLTRVAAALRDRGHEVVETREPTHRPLGKQIRAWLSADAEAPPPDAMALLFAADRLEHIANVVRPALERGAMVLCDRYRLSSFAYQGLDCPLDWVQAINRRSLDPDLTLWLKVPVEIALARAQARIEADGAVAERFDGRALQTRLHAAYQGFADDPAQGVLTVDGTQPVDEVSAQLLRHIELLLAQPR